jgi:predicted MFS family arabinose efflux permease
MIVPFIATYMVRNVGLTEAQLPFIYLVGGICTIVSARLIGRACDKIGSYKVFKFVAFLSIFPIFFLTNLPQVPLALALACSSLFMMSGSGRFIPAMTIISAVVKPEERGTFMSLENAARQLSSGLASQIAGLIIGGGTASAMTNYNVVGYIGIATSLVAIYIAFKIKTKFNLR